MLIYTEIQFKENANYEGTVCENLSLKMESELRAWFEKER